MKILKVLLTESAVAAYRDLSDTQSIVLMRVVSGQAAYETASPREKAVMDELAVFGLLDDLGYAPTQQGIAVANLTKKYGPRDARQLQARNAKAGMAQKPFEKDRRYTTKGDAGEDLDAEAVAPVSGDNMRSGSIMDKGRVSRDNAI